jgi:glycosyltransferase involved in cell wall biosynthesis
LTVHDLSFMTVPESAHPKLRSYLLKAVPASVRRADLVLADSESTRADVIELLDADPDRTEVVYPGVDSRFGRVRDEHVLREVHARYGLPDRFILGLGTLQPRKNYGRLIQAYAAIRPEFGPEIKLVIAGGAGWLSEPITNAVKECGVQNDVFFPGYVADGDLPALYSLAELLAFPSLYEGFGLPPLEAMACETPVVASDVSSLPEVIGDAGLMVDPSDVLALAGAMRDVLTDDGLRKGMIKRGVAQAQRFTWTETATRLLSVYARVG